MINSRVKKAYQDSKGRMYFLTYGGLSVYDGARFRNYSNRNGLPMNIINDVLEIGADSLLVATNSSNINLLVNGRIEPFKTEKNFTPLVNQFYRHDDGRIYLSSDFGLYVLEKNKIHQLSVLGITTHHGQPNLGNIVGAGNYLVISTNEMSENRGCFIYDIKNNRICDSLRNIKVYQIGKVGESRIWINTSDQLLFVDSVALKKGKLVLLTPEKGYQHTGGHSIINIAFGKKHMWFVYRNEEYRNSELRRIDEKGNMLSLNLSGQMTASYILNIFIDRENNIWLCNDGEGVFKIVRSSLQVFEKPFLESGEGQADNVYYSNGITWYSTISKKIYRRSQRKLESYTSNLGWSPNIFYDEGKTLLANDAHNIYKVTLQYNSAKINFQKIISLGESDFFGSKLLVDSKGAIIASQLSGVAVWVNNKLIHLEPIGTKEHVEDLLLDYKDRLWIVTRDHGIYIYRLQPKNFSNYLQLDFHIPAGQLIGSVRSFVIDKNDIIWIGTRDHGIVGYRLMENNKLQQIFHFSIGNGLSDNYVTSLACDSLNNIIVGTQSGLDLIFFNSIGSYRIENVSRNSNHFAYINTTWADSQHSYALTNSGVVLKVTTSTTEERAESPQLLLEEIKINAKTISQQQNKFNHNENNIGFLVAAPSFIDEKQIRYTYLLQGSGNERWSDTTAANSNINLTNLSSGQYDLNVKAFFHSNAYPPIALSYSFEITPPWWRTGWFRTSSGLLVIGLIIVAFRFYYSRKLEKQHAIGKERTRIATDMHDDLGAGLSRIRFLSETISIKQHHQQSIEEDITKIREYSHEMIDKIGEIVWALNEKNDSLSDLLSYTRAYTVEYLSQNGIDCKTEMPENFPSTFVSGEFRRNVFLTIKEALHNIVKHAQATEVNFSVIVNDRLTVKLKDNGTGFDKNKVRSFSNGLSNMDSRVKYLGGTFEVVIQDGTLIKLSVPLPK